MAVTDYPPPMITLRLFANLREIAGTNRIELTGATVGAVLDEAVERFGDEFRQGLEHARVWKNGDAVDAAAGVADGDELALIPPVSGGEMTTESQPSLIGSLQVYAVAILASAAVLANWAGVAWFAAAAVGIVGWWALDLTDAASERGLNLAPAPILAAILTAVVAVEIRGEDGVALAVAAAVVISFAWTIAVIRDRNLIDLTSTVLIATTAALAVGMMTATRVSIFGLRYVAVFLAVVIAAGAVATAIETYAPDASIDSVTGGTLAGILAGVAGALLWDLSLVGVLIASVVITLALIAGKALGSMIRTGDVYLSDRLPGVLAQLDGPVLAAALYLPLLLVFVGR